MEKLVSLIQALAPLGSWALVIVGWFFVQRDNRLRLLRQEQLEDVRRICTTLDEIREKTVGYLSKEGHDGELAAIVKNSILMLFADIRALRRAPGQFDLESEFVALRQALTGGDFDSASRSAVPHGSPVIQEIWVTTAAMKRELRSEFEKVH